MSNSVPVFLVIRSRIIFFPPCKSVLLPPPPPPKGAPRQWMFVKTCTGSAKPCDWKRGCQDRDVRDVQETFEALNGILSGFNNWWSRTKQCLQTAHLQTWSFAATPECFYHLNGDQWHTVVSHKLRKVVFSFFLLCLILNLLSFFHPNLSGSYSFNWLKGSKTGISSAVFSLVAPL